jgi:hypothetical protein
MAWDKWYPGIPGCMSCVNCGLRTDLMLYWDADHHKHVENPFYRGDKPTKRKEGGRERQ